MSKHKANVKEASEPAINEAAAIIRAGGLVAFPTETVYGLGADACNDDAVAAVFAAKGRPRFNPLIVHFAARPALVREVVWSARAEALADAFWPGPLTLVLARAPETRISLLASAGLDTVAVRMPAHPVARRLIAASGRPVVAPSANRFGDISPTTAAHVAASLGAACDLILDGGASEIGIESTVIDLSGDAPALLRPGAITAEGIEALIGPLERPAEGGGGPEKSPGRIARHYAPGKPLRIDARTVAADEGLLAFGPGAPPGARMTLNLSEKGDLVEAAANLFAMLHVLDAADVAAIAVAPVPEHGLGAAINDRLRRAAQPLRSDGELQSDGEGD